jgi:hypothetical protein
MKIVLRAVLSAYRIEAGSRGAELTRRRSITVSPRLGAQVVLRERNPVRAPEAGERAPAAVATNG